MKVKLLTRYAGPNGNYPPDSIIEVSSAEGAALCARRYAVPVKGMPVAAQETTSAPPVQEMAAAVPKRGPGRPAKMKDLLVDD
jgi:hypothetical protein